MRHEEIYNSNDNPTVKGQNYNNHLKKYNAQNKSMDAAGVRQLLTEPEALKSSKDATENISSAKKQQVSLENNKKQVISLSA